MQETVRADCIHEFLVEFSQYLVTNFVWDTHEKEEKEKMLKEKVKPRLTILQEILKEKKEGKEFLVGDSVTYVDYSFWCLLDLVRIVDVPTLKEFPLLNEWKEGFGKREKVKAYLESDAYPKTFTIPLAPVGGTPETS